MTDSLADEMASWITGTEDAEKRRITGGCMPAGSTARTESVAETTWVIARSMETEGWK